MDAEKNEQQGENWRSLGPYNFPKYEASDQGNVRRIGTTKNLSTKPNPAGYVFVNIPNRNDEYKRVAVHRLVAFAFIPNPGNLPTVDHVDPQRKSDNRLSNLRWASHRDQVINRVPLKNGGPKRKVVKVHATEDTELEVFDSITKAFHDTGINYRGISACCKGKRLTAGGFKWKYFVEPDFPNETWGQLNKEGVEFEVSTAGRIRTDGHGILSGSKDLAGYRVVQINGKIFKVHRLVAETFLERKPGLDIVNHKDSNKCRNVLSNLEWSNAKLNAQHAWDHGNGRKRKRPVVRIDEEGKRTEFNSITEAALASGVHSAGIDQVLAKRIKKTGGYRFERLVRD